VSARPGIPAGSAPPGHRHHREPVERQPKDVEPDQPKPARVIETEPRAGRDIKHKPKLEEIIRQEE